MAAKKRSGRLGFVEYELTDLGNAPDGIYQIRELDGEGRAAYMNSITKDVSIDEDGNVDRTKTKLNVGTFQLQLLAVSLYDPEGKLVPEEIFRKWSGQLLEEMYTDSSQLSKINVRAEDKKNTEKNLKGSEDSGSA